jgi:hypothetical protein
MNVKKVSCLLIPKYHKKEEIKEIKETLKSLTKDKEIVLHGFYHKAEKENPLSINRLFTSGEGEDLSISLKEFEKRLKEGLKILNSMDLKPEGYIAPAWLIRRKHIKILKKYGFKFTTTRYGIYDLQNNKYIFSPVICFICRKGIEELSIKSFNLQIKTYTKILKNIRIALHPCDVENPKKIKLILKAISFLKKNGREAYLSEIIRGGLKNDKGRLTSSFNSF